MRGVVWVEPRVVVEVSARRTDLSLLTDLDAFYLDHRRCGGLRAGVVYREPETVIWIECECSARIVRAIAD